MYRFHSATVAALLSCLASNAATAQSEEDLAKQLANPVASLISVPLQNNLDFGYGSLDATRYTLNFQPVYPVSLSPKWNLISRTILPIISQEAFFAGSSNEFGIGDITQSLFFSPVGTDPIWAIGPVFLIPTATDDLLGTGKWGIGPTVLVLKQKGPLTYGFLTNHIWSFAGSEDRDNVNTTFLQPFFSHTSKSAVTLSLSSESTYDWIGEQSTIPLIANISKLYTFGGQRVSLGGGVKIYVAQPDGGPEWGLRFIATFLFPR